MSFAFIVAIWILIVSVLTLRYSSVGESINSMCKTLGEDPLHQKGSEKENPPFKQTNKETNKTNTPKAVLKDSVE